MLRELAAVCAAGEGCKNRRFQQRQGQQLDVQMTDRRGWGLFAKHPIRKGSFVVEALGELIDEDEARDRLAKAAKAGDSASYMLAASGADAKGLVVDRAEIDRYRRAPPKF